MQTARAVAYNPETGFSTKVRILFDSGSQQSYITDQLCSRLKLKPVHVEKLQVNTFGGEHFKAKRCKLVKFELGKAGLSERLSVTALSYLTICSTLPVATALNEYAHLSGLELADCSEGTDVGTIDVLIGSDFYWKFVTGKVQCGGFGPVAIYSKLGWLLSGSIGSSLFTGDTYTHLILAKSSMTTIPEVSDPVQDIIRNTKSIGIVETEPEMMKELLENIQFCGNHYEVSLPWKEGKFDLPNHFSISVNRLRHLQSKLLRDPDLLAEYHHIIQDQLKRGIIEQVNASVPRHEIYSSNEEGEPIHYLPHHAIIRRERFTTKIRIVYDGSAKLSDAELSLNDCLQTGPNLIPKLFDMLVQFRSHPVAITADIEKAFLMIGIAPADCDVLRFLWFQDPSKLDSPIIQFRFTRVVFGLRPSPAILGAVILHHFDKYSGEQSQLIEQK